MMRALTFLIVLTLFGCDNRIDVEENYCGSVVMDTQWPGMYPQLTLKTISKEYITVPVYELHYNKYKLGDTIKCIP